MNWKNRTWQFDPLNAFISLTNDVEICVVNDWDIWWFVLPVKNSRPPDVGSKTGGTPVKAITVSTD